jgi:hypothetical protein
VIVWLLLRLVISVRHRVFMRHPVLVQAGLPRHRHGRGRCDGTRTDERKCDNNHQHTSQQYPHHTPI